MSASNLYYKSLVYCLLSKHKAPEVQIPALLSPTPQKILIYFAMGKFI
jgi:hypothetical protein